MIVQPTQLRRHAAFIVFLSVTLAAGAATAQSFPSKPIRLIAPYAAGGGADLMARYLCEKWPAQLGQPCVVENRPGAAGIIGVDTMLKADPDGHTLAMMSNTMTIIPALYPKMPYDTLRDVAPIAAFSATPVMLGTHPSVGAKTVAELVQYVKSNPDKSNFTTCGPASPQHLAGEMLASLAGIRWQHIPYKGCGAAIADVLAGMVPIFISTYAHFLPQIKSGKLTGIAMLGAKRSVFGPDVPTIAESGYAGFDVDVWFGLIGSSRLPAGVVARLNAEVNKALAAPDLRDKMLAGQYEPLGGTPERFAEIIRVDIAKYGKVIRDVGIKAEQ